ncbi:MAG: DUF4846 domain-containing protein [Hyphomicrobiales bacterium]|nr:DUF4846 domain-containing protein [Hyphomicrobiales bacterium]
MRIVIGAVVLAMWILPGSAVAAPYLWLNGATPQRTIETAFSPPPGFVRAPAQPGSFAAWLRGLPLKPDGAPVTLYDGRLKFDQQHHVAVIDIDTGRENLQQCADAVMRLRAEYLLAAGRPREIAFNYTNGKRQAFGGGSYADFKRYMRRIFSFAGTYSLEREMKRVGLADIAVGDVFIQGGFPGHAVMVVDLAVNDRGEKRFLLMQSYMPAQDMHVLENPRGGASAWYAPPGGAELVTPEWIFRTTDLRRF